MKVLAKFFWDCGRNGSIEGLFIADKSIIQNVVGRRVDLGEVLGKYSDIYGAIDEGDITIISEDSAVVEILLSLFEDGNISGFNPLDFIEEQDESEDESKGG